MINNCAIILAAGKGTRMKARINKQFINLKGKPILYYTLKAFENNSYISEIVLVLAEDEIAYFKENILEKYEIKKIKKIVAGGKTRQESVLKGLLAAEDSDIVLIHDGARPFLSDKLIEDGIKYAKKYGACACGVIPKDTIKIKSIGGFSSSTLERSSLFAVQTPQCFKYDIIINAHKKALEDSLKATDDTMIVERYDHKVYLYQGSYTNIKITTPEDLVVGERILDTI